MKNMKHTKKMKQVVRSMRVLLTVVFLVTAFGACHKGLWFEDGIEGSGNVISEVRNVGYFSNIELYGSGKVYVTQGPDLYLEIQAEDNIMPIIQTRLEGETLVVDTDHPFSSGIGIKIFITMPNIRGFQLHGAWKLFGQNRFNTDDLDLEITGAGRLELDVTARNIVTEISGAGSIYLSGSADSHVLVISGAGELQAEGLEVIDYDIQVSGSGNCRVHVTRSLTVVISGSGSVYYKGNPASVSSTINGSGKVVRM